MPPNYQDEILQIRADLTQIRRELSDAREALARTGVLAERIQDLEPKLDRLFGAVANLTSKMSALQVKVYLLVAGVATIVTAILNAIFGE